MKILGKSVKYFFIGVIILVYLLLMLRICSSGDPKNAVGFIWNQTAYDVYQASPDDFSAFTATPPTYITDDGRFAVSGLCWLDAGLVEKAAGKSGGQLQVTVRYNNSTVKKLIENYGLSDKPAGEPFIYVLEDGNGNVYKKYEFARFTKNVYNYRRLVFDGVDFASAGTLTLKMYYINDVDFSAEPYGSLTLWKSAGQPDTYNPGVPGGVSKELYASPEYLTIGESD